MARANIPSGLWLLIACGTANPGAPGRPRSIARPSPVPWCVVPGSTVDSTFAVAQAKTLFVASSLTLKAYSVEQVVAHVVGRGSSVIIDHPEGWLVRLAPVNPNTLGGGGLVWVDGETGCPMLLIHYE